MSVKVIGGASLGVFVPIAVEYGMQGADISTTVPVKWSGVAGIIVGAVPIGLVAAKVGPFGYMNEENKDAIVAFGAASLATGVAILVLEQLRKAQGTAAGFARRVNLPPPMQQNSLAQQYTAPVGQVIKEI